MVNEMAQKVNALLVDEIDVSDADETIPFDLDGILACSSADRHAAC